MSGLTRGLRRLTFQKNVDRLLAEAGDKKGLAKTLGARDLIILGVAGIIGAGIFVLIGEGIEKAGVGVIPAFIVAAAICAVAGFAYAELAASVPASGSAYAYIYAVLGELPGWLVAWALILEYAVGAIAVAVGWRSNLLALINQFHDSNPNTDVFTNDPAWFGGATDLMYRLTHSPFESVRLDHGTVSLLDDTVLTGWINLPSILIVLLCTLLLVRGTKESARFTAVLVVIKASILVLAIVGGFLALNLANLGIGADALPPLPSYPEEAADGTVEQYDATKGFAIPAIFAAAAIMFFAYIGFDSVSTTAEETRNPKKDLPRGILGSLAITTVLYILAAIALTGSAHWSEFIGDGVGPTNARNEPFGYVFEKIGFLEMGGFGLGALLVRIGALVGTTSVLIVLILGGVRVFFNMSRDGLLPRWMSQVGRRGNPASTTMFYGAFTLLFAGVLDLGAAVNLVNIGTLFAFFMVILAAWVFRARRPDVERPFRMPMWALPGVAAWVAWAILAFAAIAGLAAAAIAGADWVLLAVAGTGALLALVGLFLAIQATGSLPAFVVLGLLGTLGLILSLDGFTLWASLTWGGLGVLLYALYGVRRSKEAAERVQALTPRPRVKPVARPPEPEE